MPEPDADTTSTDRGRPITGVAVGAIAVVAAAVRIGPRWSHVLGGDVSPRLPGADSWHHLRHVEQLLRHGRRMQWDAFALHPDGQRAVTAPLFDYLAAVTAWVAGAGDPSPQTIAVVMALLPVVLGAGTCVLAYFLGRRVGGRVGGVFAAAVVAVLPGQFFGRTLLGFADHHALEAFLATAVILAFCRALDRPRAVRDTTLLAALLLAYLWSWSGGALLVLVLAIAAVVVLVLDHGTNRKTAPGLSLMLVVAFCAVAGGSAPGSRFHAIALAGALVAVVGTGVLSHYTARAGATRGSLVGSVTVLGGIAAFVCWHWFPELTRPLFRALSWFAGTEMGATVGEAQPLLFPGGELSYAMAWVQFGFMLPVALFGLVRVAKQAFRHDSRVHAVIFVWSVLMLLVTLGQNRFGYYSTVCVAVLAGAVVGPLLVRLWTSTAEDAPPVLVRRGLWPLAVASLLIGPSIGGIRARHAAAEPPSDAWLDAMVWMRDNTPPPFDSPDAFREELSPHAAHQAYGVLCWWDAGYWVTQIAQRIPSANPTQSGAASSGQILCDTDPSDAADAMRDAGLRYAIVSRELAYVPDEAGSVEGAASRVIKWAGLDEDTYFADYYEWDTGPNGVETLVPLTWWHEDYFRSLMVRLWAFGGHAVTVADCTVITWEDQDGMRVIQSFDRFEDYGNAREFLEQLDTPNARIVSSSPVESCVPLDAATEFELVHDSPDSAVRVFELR